MGIAGVKKNTSQGTDFNYFRKVAVNWSNFGGGASDGIGPDLVIPFSTQTIMFLNEGSGVIEVSYDGNNLHNEFDSTSSATKFLTFENRVISTIWFRVKSGSTGPITISVIAWGIR